MAASICLVALGGASAPGSVEADLSGLRSAKGQVLACLTARPDRFPNCQDDPQARRVKLTVADGTILRFDGLASGHYAIAMIHDENGNGRMDTVMGIPREGFGFSRNPAIRFGPPRFAEAEFPVASGAVEKNLRVRYLL